MVDDHRESSISQSDRVSGVVNHMLRLQPHQGLGAQETGALERSHTPKSWALREVGGWAGAEGSSGGLESRPRLPQSGCTHMRPWAFSEASRCSVTTERSINVRAEEPKWALSKSVNENVLEAAKLRGQRWFRCLWRNLPQHNGEKV